MKRIAVVKDNIVIKVGVIHKVEDFKNSDKSIKAYEIGNEDIKPGDKWERFAIFKPLLKLFGSKA